MRHIKVFGVVEGEFIPDAGCYLTNIKEKTLDQLYEELDIDRNAESNEDLMEFLKNATPGEYMNFHTPIFRIR